MPVGERVDPYAGFRFRVEIEGIVVAGFSEVSGLALEVGFEDFTEGGVNGFTHRLPRATRHPALVLKRGLTDSDALWSWQRKAQVSKARIERRTVRIFILDSQGNEKTSWRCLQAYPVTWRGPEFDGELSRVAFESIELAHCGIERS